MEIAENLRELASELRKLAASLNDHPDNKELDSEKVLDFLIFYGGGGGHAS